MSCFYFFFGYGEYATMNIGLKYLFGPLLSILWDIYLGLELLGNYGSSWRRQWHPTPVLSPGNPMDGGAW